MSTTIERYVTVDRMNREGEVEYDTLEEAIEAARVFDGAVIEREYTYSDSSLAWTPSGEQTWPPEEHKAELECNRCGDTFPEEQGRLVGGDMCEDCRRTPAEGAVRTHTLHKDGSEIGHIDTWPKLSGDTCVYCVLGGRFASTWHISVRSAVDYIQSFGVETRRVEDTEAACARIAGA